MPWGQSRSWTNGPGYDTSSFNGNGWVVTQMPTLVSNDGGTNIAVVMNGTNALTFELVSGVYVAQFSAKETLTYNSTSKKYTLTTTTGDKLVFSGLSDANWRFDRQGQFESFTDAAGNVTQVTSRLWDDKIAEIQRTGTSGSDTVTESYLYAYVRSGVVSGNLASVTLRQRTNSGPWTTVRKVEYTYYNGTESNGNLDDLKTAVIKDGAGNVLNTDYYRYYVTSESYGYKGGLKYVFKGDSYLRLKAAYSDPTTATDAQADDYANNYFRYDSSQRVTQEVAQQAGCSACSGGLGTFGYAYTSATHGLGDGYNYWKIKTVETLPDGNENIVYTNAYAQPILKVAHNTTTSQKWLEYFQYDTAGRLIIAASPSGVSGYNEAYGKLVIDNSGANQYLNTSSGRFTLYNFAGTTTATTSTAGNVAGYLQNIQISHGYGATAITQEAWQYIAHTDANGVTIYPVASDTVYRNDNGTGDETTSYAYTWFTNTNLQESVTVSRPVVSSGQNGPGSADTETAYFDTYGRPIWTKDGDGFLTFIAYEPFTGAVKKTITDVDSTQTSTFSNKPSGWTTPSGGGLQLVALTTLDELGRPTAVTDPNGNVTYIVYNDANHEVRVYPGFNSATGMPTGPTQVYREDLTGTYTEMLTMSATPNLTGGVPNGTEAIASIQSLSRTYANNAGQVVSQEDYFNLSGVTYSTTAHIGTEGTHYYKTEFAYDVQGRPSRVKSPTGTITRTVYDFLGRAVSVWVGTNDTPGSGSWSPTNNTSPANMVQVKGAVYDNGGIGDSNLTSFTEYPNGITNPRKTDVFYDWRNRPVAIKGGVEDSESTSTNRPIVYRDYDNLNQVTKERRYDGDNVTITFTSGVPNAPSSSLLRAQTETAFDDQGRVYQQKVDSVDPSGGSVSTYALTTNLWYDHRGNVIKIAEPGGLVTKQKYDGAGRPTITYFTDGGSDSAWSDADDVTGDAVLEQQEVQYDANGNPIVQINRQRFHDETATGVLVDASTSPKARVSYVANYFDKANRLTAGANYGTYGAASWSRPSSAPSASDTILVTSYGYAADAVQQVSLTGSPTGGTFTLTYNGQTTSAIAYNASAATVQSALQALSTIGSGNVLVTGPAGGPWQIRFANSLGGKVVFTLTGSGAGLTGGTSPSVAVALISQGGDAGRLQQVTDPKGIVNKTDYDWLGRVVRQINAFSGFAPTDSTDATTAYTYDGANHVLTITAVLPANAKQETQYVYGVTTPGSGVNSNDLLATVKHPDPSTGAASSSQQDTYKYNAVGQIVTATDRNGNEHTYTYDVLGRLTSDAITTLGSGVDGAVRRIETAYDTAGNPFLFTSYDAASSGNIVNQVQRVYNGLGQLITEYQSHSGAVNTGTTPKVQYVYSEMASGANHSRLIKMTYPNGRILHFGYSSGVDASTSRLSFIADDNGSGSPGTHLEEYTYLGLGTVAKRAHPEPGVDLAYIKRSGESNGDAGDQYTGLDRFGRIVDQRWLVASSGTATDRFQYGYDRDSNRLFAENLIDATFSELYSYDTENQLASFQRGTLNGTKTGLTGSASRSQSWNLDALGNWESITTDSSTQNRTHNLQNEVTGVGSATLTFDNNGNLTTDANGNQYVYDAWNRLVKVKDSGNNVLTTYGYDSLGRRVSENPGTARDLYYSASWQLLEERVGGNAQGQYVWSPVYVDAMVLRDRDTDANGSLDERLYVAQDANWNVTSLINTSGSVVERFVYDAYGSVSVLTPSWSVAGSSSYSWLYFFQGKRRDGTVGLDDSRMRVYSATLGRWLQRDPIGFSAGDLNVYRFVQNATPNALDPLGLDAYLPLQGGGGPSIGPDDFSDVRYWTDQLQQDQGNLFIVVVTTGNPDERSIWDAQARDFFPRDCTRRYTDVDSWKQLADKLKNYPTGSIRILVLGGHNYGVGIQVDLSKEGASHLNSTELAKNPELARFIASKLSRDALVDLECCCSGQNKKGMTDLANLLQAIVLGRTGFGREWGRPGDGQWVIIRPNKPDIDLWRRRIGR